ncbi:MAG: shikimate dehydrogenase [Saprospiraceae bacterium]
MKFGLIGYPLTHSFSKKYFDAKFISLGLAGFTYQNFSLNKIGDIIPILAGDLLGLNVTIPYKSAVIDYLDEIDHDAEEIGAVNTLVQIENSKWKGFNTDGTGFKFSLENWIGENLYPEKALILGSGGAAKAIKHALFALGIQPAIVSRGNDGDYSYDNLTPEVIGSNLLIINASPLGMSPQENTFPPIPYEALSQNHWLYDVVYNPTNTLFLARGEQMGAHTKNGLEMLHLQAEQAWVIWKTYGRF